MNKNTTGQKRDTGRRKILKCKYLTWVESIVSVQKKCGADLWIVKEIGP